MIADIWYTCRPEHLNAAIERTEGVAMPAADVNTGLMDIQGNSTVVFETIEQLNTDSKMYN